MTLEAKRRGGERHSLNKIPHFKTYDLSDEFSILVRDKLAFYHARPYPTFANDITTSSFAKRPVIPAIDVSFLTEVEDTDFYPIDLSLTAEEVKLIPDLLLLEDISVLKGPVSRLVNAISHTINTAYMVAVQQPSEWESWVACKFAPADSILYAGSKAKIAYLFLVGDEDSGYRLESETSFVFYTKEKGKNYEGY